MCGLEPEITASGAVAGLSGYSTRHAIPKPLIGLAPGLWRTLACQARRVFSRGTASSCTLGSRYTVHTDSPLQRHFLLVGQRRHRAAETPSQETVFPYNFSKALHET